MEITKEYLDQKFDHQNKDLKDFVKKEINEQTESLARMVSVGFNHVNEQFKEVHKEIRDLRVEVRGKNDQHDLKFRKLEQHLDLDL